MYRSHPPRTAARRAVWLALLAAGWLSLAPVAAQARDITLLNVSYDPTREFYQDYNAAFSKHWKARTGDDVTVRASHGGSGKQARSVIDGLEAEVVTLALAYDIDAIAAKGLIAADWSQRLKGNSAPYTSTIVFLVRKGNPRQIRNWDDLVKPGVSVITPNPKTSGGARWNYLAAYAFELQRNGGDHGRARAFVQRLFQNVPVLDAGARGSTVTFAERGQGDVLLAWENEAHLALKELGDDQFDIVVPSISVLAEPPVALVEGHLTDATRPLAAAYLEQLYSPEAQALALKHFYRAWDTSKADPADVARFAEVERLSIADFGGWAKVQPEHFGDGGIFDQIYQAQ